jgi:hypothetical protein
MKRSAAKSGQSSIQREAENPVLDVTPGRHSLSLARSDLRRAERHLPAAPNLFLAKRWSSGGWGDERQRQERGLADRSPGVAHGGGGQRSTPSLLSRARARRADSRGALRQTDLLEPPGRRCGCWSTSQFLFSGIVVWQIPVRGRRWSSGGRC